MKSLLFFFAICVSLSLSAQTGEPVVPFTNYGSCYQGLKYENGKILWEADFESLAKIYDYENRTYRPRYYWIAEKNGYFGFIDPEGVQILPFRFNRIQSAYPWRKGIIASDDSGCYLYSNSGEIELTLEGYSWFEITENGYIVEKNGQRGFLDLALNQVLPTEYDQLAFETVLQVSEGMSTIASTRFIRIEQDHQTAMYDLKNQKWIIPKTSEYIDPNWVQLCSESDAIFHLSNDTNHTFRVVRSDGNEVYSGANSIDAEILLTPLDSCGTLSHQLMYIYTDEATEVVSLKTGKRSENHSLVYPLDGYSILFEKKKWGVLDPDLNLLGLYKYPKTNESYNIRKGTSLRRQAEFPFDQYFAWDYYDWFAQIGFLTDSVLITRRPDNSERKDDYYGDNYGLFNFHSGKNVKTTYDGITLYDFQGKTIYWATNVFFFGYETGAEIKQLDIYDTDLNRVKSFSGSMYLERIPAQNSRNCFIITSNQKVGVINPLGEEIVPIIYDECHRKEIRSIDDISKKEPIFIASKKGEPTTIYDFQGNKLVEKQYWETTIHGQLLIASREDHLNDIYDSKGNLLLEGFKYQRDSPRINEFGKCIGFDDPERLLVSNCTYFTKGDQVYEFRQGKMYLLDENFFQFTQKYCFFLEWIIIDKTGKIITTHPKGVTAQSYRYKQEHPSECSTYLDEYPIPEPPKKETNRYVPPQEPYTPTKKLYTWKQHDRNKPDEWFLYNQNDVLMYPESFEYPLSEEGFYGGVFMQNGKYGYFDSKYNQYLPAEYDYIYPPWPITLKNGKWQIHHRNSGKVSPEFDAVSLDYRNYLHFVFNDGKIGVINDSMEFIIPLTDSVGLINNYDLVKLLNLRGYGGQAKTYIHNNLIYNGEPSLLYRKINNIHLLEQVTLNSTKNSLLKFSPVNIYKVGLPTGLKNKIIYYNENQTIRERRPTHANRSFYSETTYTWNKSWYNENWSFATNDHFKVKDFFNYKIVGNELIPIQFSDLFKTDQQSVDKLNKIILEKLTRIQAFGENCTDIDSKIEELKQKFAIENGQEIVLYWQNIGGFIIRLPFSEIENVLLEPKKLKDGL